VRTATLTYFGSFVCATLLKMCFLNFRWRFNYKSKRFSWY